MTIAQQPVVRTYGMSVAAALATASDAQLVAELDDVATAIQIDPPFTDAVIEVEALLRPAVVAALLAQATDEDLVAEIDDVGTALEDDAVFTDALLRTEAESRALAIDVPTVADLASLPTGISNGTAVDVTSPAIRVQRVSGAWRMTGASGGGVYTGADLAALVSLLAQVTPVDLTPAYATDTGIEWLYASAIAAWLPAYPLGLDGGRITSVTALVSAVGVDPRDAPTSATDDSIATYTVDDTTTPGTVIYTDGNDAGRVMLSMGGAPANGVHYGCLVTGLRYTTTGSPAGGVATGELSLNAYVDASNSSQISCRAYPGDGTDWRTVTSGPTVTATATAYGTDSELRMFIRSGGGVASVWSGDGDADRPRIFDGAARHIATTGRTLTTALGSNQVLFLSVGSTSVAGTSTLDADAIHVFSFGLTGS